MGFYRKITKNGISKFQSLAGANSGGLPVGTIIAFYGTKVPSGYLPCHGQQFDKNQFPFLYTFLGTDILPDLREVTLVGVGTSERQDITSHDVYTLGQFKDDQLQGHQHYFGYGASGAGGSAGVSCPWSYNSRTSSIVNDGTNGNPRYGKTTHGKQVGVNYLIKAVTGVVLTEESTEVTQAIELAEESIIQAIGTAEVSDPIKAYMDNQNLLDDPEYSFTISTSSADPWVAPYDGYFCFGATSGATTVYRKNEDDTWTRYAYTAGNSGDDSLDVYPFVKGEEFYASRSLPNGWVRYYKLRDYSGR